jgi:hypothetical protein
MHKQDNLHELCRPITAKILSVAIASKPGAKLQDVGHVLSKGNGYGKKYK